MNAHPILLVYRKTECFSFPLILAIGREPNSNEVISQSVGYYDWRDSPRGFWATSNEVVAETLGVKAREYKSECQGREASVVAIANAMPRAAEEGSGQQTNVRNSTPEAEIKQHFENLLKLRDILSRVKYVWLCGLNATVFDYSRRLLEESYLGRVPSICLPHMRNTNRRGIRRMIRTAPEHEERTREIFDAFKQETALVAP